MNMGYVYAVLAYIMWGLLPIYWKLYEEIGAGEILAHRIIWSVVFVMILLTFSKRWSKLKRSVPDLKSRLAVVMCSILITANWLIYIWAVQNGRILEASLGYYINPLVNVFLGVFLLGERLSKLQWTAIALAGVGVLITTLSYGQFPWVSITLALSFALYGYTKKKVQVDPTVGLSLETLVVLPFALLYLAFVEHGGQALEVLSGWKLAGLTLAGVATALPLLFFAQGVKRLPLSVMGIIQYMSPTISLLLGVLVYGEEFTSIELLSFGLIWSALVLYTLQMLKKPKLVAVPAGAAKTS
ncbi:EamA family transporter RarD [Tumebacillus sp. BK434]|uniref:EamA family transporter RarD n=1 Tax=Tumebacillus sp. BK434 TaxID=2512169 RepID=UPI00104F6E16|nr:EamA family transporter RarD [Tumebacillus sp. BK434]